MRRREFITLIGGAVTTWPLTARAQQMRRIGVLLAFPESDLEGQSRVAAFQTSLQELGWIVGRNLQIDYRWSAGAADENRKYAAEIVALAPDAILAAGGQVVAPLLQATRSIPIVFTQTADPVGAGFVDSLAHPGGNATGFTNFEFGMSGKWLELLKQAAPNVKRVGVIRDPAQSSGTGQFGAIQSVAPSFGVELSPIGLRDAGEIERAITAFAKEANGGLIVTAGALVVVHRDLLIRLAAQQRLPTVYPFRIFAAGGGLISYGPDTIDPHRRAATYIDRILKGEKPADLPVQGPTKYELVINLKTAKTLGSAMPPDLLARADEVIE